MNLSQFTPAETLVLTRGSNVLLKDHLKFTFMDLLLKQVLVSTRKKYQPDPRSKAIMMTYISTGVSFKSYAPLSHEQVFTLPFVNGNRNIQFKFMVKMAYEQAVKYSDYDPIILKSPSTKGLVKKNFFQLIFGGYSWTSEGHRVKEALKKELISLDKDLPVWMQNDHKKALEIILAIKGNLFLLKNIDFELLRNFDKEISYLQQEFPSDYTFLGYDFVSFDSSWIHDNHHSWDSGFDNLWDSVSGCNSSDSSCSTGCSGCGGCGGD